MPVVSIKGPSGLNKSLKKELIEGTLRTLSETYQMPDDRVYIEEIPTENVGHTPLLAVTGGEHWAVPVEDFDGFHSRNLTSPARRAELGVRARFCHSRNSPLKSKLCAIWKVEITQRSTPLFPAPGRSEEKLTCSTRPRTLAFSGSRSPAVFRQD